ncbi:MAG: ATP-binding protein [Fluviicoccus sp.]|uniref:hybrid sensor histidine kinase/response regulator n=1 Tax=Fluviicoccus sp. TaxID=2003552 RepID=UPI002723066D|nr:ATP-binding protein [Fluviicoccus sp.]MDO8330945.1 ATP-binding protein [Fluviicoccus sp.]
MLPRLKAGSLRFQSIAGIMLLVLFLACFQLIILAAEKSTESLIGRLDQSVSEMVLGWRLNNTVQGGLRQCLMYADTDMDIYLEQCHDSNQEAQKIVEDWLGLYSSSSLKTDNAGEEVRDLHAIDRFLKRQQKDLGPVFQSTDIDGKKMLLLTISTWEGWVNMYFDPRLEKIIADENHEIATYIQAIHQDRQVWARRLTVFFVVAVIVMACFFAYYSYQNLRAIDAIEDLSSEYALGRFDAELAYAPGEFAKLAMALEGMAMALQRSTVDRDMLTGIMDSQLDMVFVFDRNAKLEFANSAAVKALNSPLSPIGASLLQLFNVSESEAVELMRTLLKNPSARWNMYQSRFGEVIEISASTWVSRSTSQGFILVVRDITEQEKLHERNLLIEHEALETEIRARELESASLTRQRFMTNMSHELRTPLHGILGLAELMEAARLTENQSRLMAQLRKAGKHMLLLIDDILDVSKLESGKIQLESREIDLVDLIEDVLDTCASKAFESHLTLVQDIDYRIDWSFLCDEKRVKQILLNLLSNAIKFTSKGQVVLSLRKPPEGGISFGIMDTGIGIPPEKQELIFEPFSQADDSTTRRFGGTGLGLTIVRQIAEAMGGHVSLQSEPGKGSTFTVFLPLKMVHESNSAPEWLEEYPSQLPSRYLVVAETTMMYRACESLLKAWGQTVTYAGNCMEAIRLLSEAALNRPFDCCLISWRLMQDDSGAAWQSIRDRFPDLRLVAMGPGSITSPEIGNVILPLNRYRFYAALWPLVLADDRQATAMASQASVDMLAGKTILVAEDNLLNQQYVAAILESLGGQVILTDTGIGAVEWFRKQPFDLILMDGQMPGMDGYQATRSIRMQEAYAGNSGLRTPIVALTAHAMAEDKQRCLNAGMDDYLAKPFDSRQLREVLARWLPASIQGHDRVAGYTDIPSPVNVEKDRHESTSSLYEYDVTRLDMIRQLQRPGQPPILDGFIANYLSNTPDSLQELNASVRKQDYEAVSFHAHKLKSGAATMGLVSMSELCKTLEFTATDETKQTGIPALLTELDDAYAQASIWLNNQAR